jgi:hypothetical protein
MIYDTCFPTYLFLKTKMFLITIFRLSNLPNRVGSVFALARKSESLGGY